MNSLTGEKQKSGTTVERIVRHGGTKKKRPEK